MHEIIMSVDGACKGNPGPAGIGVVLVGGPHRKELSKAIGHATNNIAELTAVLEGLKALKEPAACHVTLYTDSQLVYGLLALGWKPKANRALVAEMQAWAAKCASLTVVKVAGHSGDPLNERADALASQAASHADPAALGT